MSPPLDGQLEVAALSGEMQAVMEGIVARLMEFEGADGASLSTIDDEYTYFKVCAGADKELEGQTLPLAATLGIECVRRGDVTVLRATTGPEVARCLTPGAGAIILAPIEYDGAFQGVLGVRSADPEAFNEQEVETLRLLTRGASIALRNAELVERLAGSERRYRELHEHAADAMLVSDDESNLIDANDAAAALLGYSVEELRAMHASELIDGASLEQEPLHRAELLAQGELRGERPYRRKDGALVEAEYSARVLDDGRVHTTLRDIGQRKRDEHRLRTTLARMHAIVQIQQEISTLELDADAVTKAIVERAQELTGADGATIHWFEEDESVFLHASGIAAPHTGHRLDREVGLASLAARSRKTLYVPDTLTDDRVDQPTARQIGARSLICAPLYRDGAAAGVLAIMSAEPGVFDELDVETTRMMAEFVSSVIRNSNELEERRRLVESLRTQGDVVHHMQTGLWIWARDGDTHRLEYANAAGAAAIGRAADDIVGKTLAEVLPGAAGPTLELVNRVADTGERIDTAEIEYSNEQVEPSVFSVKAFPLPNERVAISFENVTEKAHAQRALQESEARFRGAFYSSSLGMALETLDGTFLQVNDRLVEMLGYTIDELTSLGVRGITHVDDVDGDLELGARLHDGEIDAYHREKRYVRKDGSIFWAELTVSLVAGYDGQPSNVLSHVQDITAQKQASLLFEASFERSVVPQLFANDSRQVVDINKAGADLLGVTHDEALSSTVDQLLADEAVAELWPVFLKAGALDAEVTLHRPDGSMRRVEFTATANIRPGRHLAVVRDLTLQKELEVQLRQAQKMEAVGRLAGGIAHDFNNLLTAIAGYSEFLIAGHDDSRLRRHAEEIKKAAARAAALTGQLLAFSRRQVLQPRVLDLNAVVSDMDMMLRRLIGEDVELLTMLEPSLASILADPTQLEQVIVNLAVNARDAMSNGGSVTIETANVETEEGGFVELRLTDTGVGMTDAERQQLFDPFYTTKEGGTGLGLATVYGIVQQSGGTIEVDSSPGMGSSFRILFPRVDEPAEVPVAPALRAPPQPGSETVLLVEDETVVRQLVAEILEMSGYTVLQAADGPSALELLRRQTGDVGVLVTDVVMPGMSGPEVAQAVTSMRPGTQVLYMSGYTDSAIGHHGVLEPGIAFLQKPFSADDLTRKVRALLDEAALAVD